MILEPMPQITFSASADGTSTYFNNFFLNYSGIASNTALKNGWLGITNPDQYDAALKVWEHSLQTLENFNMEFQLKGKSDGMYRCHVYRATAIINDSGIITSWVGATADIDEQKAKEKAKDEFISIPSHELKTPLTSAKAYVQLIEHSNQKKDDNDKQVVVNLLTNAIKYSPAEDTAFVNASEENDALKVSVKDNGIGISKKNLNKIFDSYYREEELASHFQGLGISLSIAKEIINRHNGKIWAVSEPGKGGIFYFTLQI